MSTKPTTSGTYYRDQDADPKLLKGAKIAVLGYGSQGRAHALNLHDGGLNVVVGLRAGGPTAKQAAADGLAVSAPADAVRDADLVSMLVPDMAQPTLFRDAVAPNLKDGATLMFAHGFNIHFRQIEPRKTIDVSMVAPKGPGALVRRQYQQGQGVPCLVAVHQDATGRTLIAPFLMRTTSAARAPGSSAPPSPRKLKPTCSVSKPSCAVASLS